MDKIPEVINDAETKYSEYDGERFAVVEMMSGGVTTPANMAKECWSPRRNPRNKGISELRPKNGCVLGSLLVNGRSGTKR